MKLGTAMRALCSGDSLLRALESLSETAGLHAGARRGTVHVDARDNTVTLALSAGSAPVSTTIPAAVLHRGSAVAPAGEFLELVRHLGATDIGLASSHGAEKRLQLRANGRTYLLPAAAPKTPPGEAGPPAVSPPEPPLPALPPLVDATAREHEPKETAPAAWPGEQPRREPVVAPAPAGAPTAALPAYEPKWLGLGRVRPGRLTSGAQALAGTTLLALVLLGVGLLPLAHAVRALALVGAAAVAALIPLVDARFRRDGDLLEPGVLVGLACLVLFPGRALVVLFDLDPLEHSRVDAASFTDVRRTLAVAAVGILAGSLAYVSPVGRALGSRVRLPRARVAERPGRYLPLALFAIGLAAQATILAGERVAAAESLLAGRSSGIVSGSSVLMMLGLALLARRAALTADGEARRALVAAIGLALVASLAGQFKEVAILAIATPVLVWALTTQVRIQRRWLVLAAAVALAMFAAVTVWRHASTRVDSDNPATVAAAFPRQVVAYSWSSGGERAFRPWTPLTETASLVSHRLYGYESLALAVIYTPSVVPHQDGDTLANLAAGLVPRVVWPSKPTVGIGYWFAQTYWGTPPGVLEVPQSVTHLGELWIDFGWLGIVLGSAILGFWYRFVHAALAPRASGTGAVLYAIVLLTILPVDRDLPLVYVTLVQRLVFVGLVFGGVALLTRTLERRA